MNKLIIPILLTANVMCFSMAAMAGVASITNAPIHLVEAEVVSVEQADTTVSTIDDIPLAKRIYFFQHKILPQWLFESNEQFFADLRLGENEQFFETAAKVVNAAFADNINITPLNDRSAFLITFPAPTASPNCYFVLIKKQGGQFRYYTFEKRFELADGDFFAIVGGWDNKGAHANYGPRRYQTEQAFVADVLAKE
ncbi:hypothetical protein ACFOD0_04435 [Shewanella intestini]|uniref:Uncharacterized protein n=1 Tax=Shewanella intestini TaxID=2017544 RepID=A0ABS5I0V6_9GAMM|nr:MULTISPECIES: hypothetical protein [Shewanella]MBR9727551.1 hypothetical protein [Shewanella intestini]MRG35299.1 hypothetical protein [Shewanella sp. XMDDZSB0408]